MTKEILIRVGDDTIYLTLSGKAGAVRSSFKDGLSEDDLTPDFDNMIDAIEALVLGHACAGVDVESPAYAEGLQTAFQALANHS
jgi:hypothetical protein